MRPVLPLILFVFSAVLPLGVHAKDPSKIDAAKQNEELAPKADNSAPMAPSRESNQRPFLRNDHLQDQRFQAPEMIERKESALGDKRAPIDMKEKRDKTIIDRKEFPKPDVRERELNSHDGERSSIQPKGDQILKYDTVAKYQDRMKDAETAASQRQPKMEKRTTFDKINRFMFKRNGPGSEDGTPMVTPAAGGSAPTPQDTYTKYNVDWSNTAAAPR